MVLAYGVSAYLASPLHLYSFLAGSLGQAKLTPEFGLACCSRSAMRFWTSLPRLIDDANGKLKMRKLDSAPGG